jgi:hypothetical protein
LSLEGYYKKYFDYPTSVDRNYLVMANTGAGFGGKDDGFASFGFDRLVSEGEGKAYGVELFVQKKLSELPYYGILSVSYNKSFFTALDGIERSSSYDQRWIVNFGGGYQFSEKWEAGWKFRLATGRPYTSFDEDGNKDSSQYNSERLDTNHNLDLRVERRWFFNSFALITFLDVQNVYDQKASEVPRWNEREQIAESDDSIGRLPTIGISLLF